MKPEACAAPPTISEMARDAAVARACAAAPAIGAPMTRSAAWPLILGTVLRDIDGADKGAKILQYSMRMLHAVLSLRVPLSRVQRLIKSLSRSRKGFRLLRCMYCVPEILESTSSSALAVANGVNSVLGFCNDLLDDVVFVGAFGFLRDEIVARADALAEKIWFITCFFDIAFLVIKWYHISMQLRSVSDQQKATALRYKRFVVLVGLVKMFGDLTIATSYACNIPLSKRTIAIAGLVSGSASFYKLWLKAAAATAAAKQS